MENDDIPKVVEESTPTPAPANTEEVDAMQEDEVEMFSMSEEECENIKMNDFNPYLRTEDMETKKPYKFKAVSEIVVKELPDKFDKQTHRNMIVTIEGEDGLVYDIMAKEKPHPTTGKWSSMGNAIRKIFKFSKDNATPVKGVCFTLTKNEYNHKEFGETSGVNIGNFSFETIEEPVNLDA